MDIYKLEEMEEKEIFPGIYGKFVHSEQMTLAFVKIDAGVELPEHAHVHEQVLNVIEGEMEITINGETKVLKSGTSLVLPSNLPHGGRTITACKVIDVFQPVREDFKSL